MEIRWDDHRRDSLQRLILRVNCLPRIEKTISKVYLANLLFDWFGFNQTSKYVAQLT